MAKYGCQPKLTGTGMTPVLVSVVRWVEAVRAQVRGDLERVRVRERAQPLRMGAEVQAGAQRRLVVGDDVEVRAAVDEAVDRVAVPVVDWTPGASRSSFTSP